MKYWTRTAIGLGLVTAALLLENWALYKLVHTGTCATGGPYVSARPCPAGTGLQIMSIFFALLIGGIGLVVFATRGGRREGGTLGVGVLAWSLGFITNGITGLVAAFGPAASDVPGSKLGAGIVAGVFIPMGLGPLVLGVVGRGLKGRVEKLEKGGKRAPAVITAIQDTGVTINESPRVKLTARAEPPGETPFDVTQARTVSRVKLPRVGDQCTVLYNPGKPAEGEIELHDAPMPATPKSPFNVPATWTPQPRPAAAPGGAAGSDDEAVLDRLKKLGDLHKSGVLTDAEFEAKKSKLLGEL